IPLSHREYLKPGNRYYIRTIYKTKFPETPVYINTPDIIDMVDVLIEDPDLIITEIGSKKVQVWSRLNKRAKPVVLPRLISLDEPFTEYMGMRYNHAVRGLSNYLYAASTPEQAKAVISQHRRLVENSCFSYAIKYTRPCDDKRAERQIEEDLLSFWNKHSYLFIGHERKLTVKIRHSSKKRSALSKTAWRPKGIFFIRDGRTIIHSIYAHMILSVLFRITTLPNLVWAFLRGIAETTGKCITKRRSSPILVFALPHREAMTVQGLLEMMDIDTTNTQSNYRTTLQVKNIVHISRIIAHGLFTYSPNIRRSIVDAIQEKK
ncbi:MAG: hypothetical protein ACTSW4_01690, partial [Candidatus Ranarchaeia archaeon]